MLAEAYLLEGAGQDWVPKDAGPGVVRWLRRGDEVQCGIWKCTKEEEPDVYEGEFEMNKTLMVLSGRSRVEIVGGPTFELGPGDCASFVKGTVGRWTLIEDLEEFFVYS